MFNCMFCKSDKYVINTETRKSKKPPKPPNPPTLQDGGPNQQNPEVNNQNHNQVPQNGDQKLQHGDRTPENADQTKHEPQNDDQTDQEFQNDDQKAEITNKENQQPNATTRGQNNQHNPEVNFQNHDQGLQNGGQNLQHGDPTPKDGHQTELASQNGHQIVQDSQNVDQRNQIDDETYPKVTTTSDSGVENGNPTVQEHQKIDQTDQVSRNGGTKTQIDDETYPKVTTTSNSGLENENQTVQEHQNGEQTDQEPQNGGPKIQNDDETYPRVTTISDSGVDPNGSVGSSRKPSSENDEIAEVRRRSGVQVTLPKNYEDNMQAALPNFPKTKEEQSQIRSAIEKNDFLNKIIQGQRLQDVINAMESKEISPRETIIKQGGKGSEMYVSAKGKYQIVIKGKVVQEFEDIRVFGELAILYNAKRLASIKAVTAGKVWVLNRDVYQQIMLGSFIKEQDEILTFLQNISTLNVIGTEALHQVANLLKTEFFASGTQIVRQGDKGDKFYIIRAGTVTVTKDGEGVVGQLVKGGCFGELALQKEDCRQATVTADPPGVECLTLTRPDFIAHFGDVEITKIKVKPAVPIEDAQAEYGDINLPDLKIIKTLGVGGFGRVELVQHRKKKDLVFALKYLKKYDIVMQHQQEHVHYEKIIQMNSRSPFIVRLYRTYKDNKYVYFLMESCLGGDLWSLLQKQKNKRFEEKEARFLAACVLESFDYLHSRGIVYRDLKPENLLIDKRGYIKLTDFGFAKKMTTRGKTFTFAGTPEYVAPEIVLNRGHDRAVDYWAYGVFVFELLTGRTPFRTNDSGHMRTYNKILNGIDNVNFPTYVNLKARALVEKLCRPVPADRLGMQRGGIKDIKGHKWFLGFDWQKFGQCEIPSPFKPRLRDVVDTSNFDQFKQDKDTPPDELSGWDSNF